MSEATLLESRLSKVEQDNRRLKLALGALLLVMAAVPLIGAVMPEQVQDTVRARNFQVIDENGNWRAAMNENGIVYYDENFNLRVQIDERGINYLDENQTPRAWISENGFTYRDENNHTRAQLGSVGLVTPSTGATTTYPAQVVLYDDDRNVIWSAVGR